MKEQNKECHIVVIDYMSDILLKEELGNNKSKI